MNQHMEFADEGLEILGEQECLRLLESARVGRVAVSLGAIPAVLPVNYAVVGGDVVFFTGAGIKLDAAMRGQSVAFEVDDIDVDHECGWSVMVIGQMLDASPATRARAEAQGLYPWAPGERHHLVRIRREMVSGRRILTGATEGEVDGVRRR
jgi:uncharacterized protein